MRGGTQLQLEKEGMERSVARDKVGRKGTGKGTEKETPKLSRVKEINCVVFVPATPGSKLRDMFKQRDDSLSETLNAPALRFVERGGNTVLDKVGQNDP